MATKAPPAPERHALQNRRPLSQDSTTSTRSVTTQSNVQEQQNLMQLEMYARQFQGHPQQQQQQQDPRHHMNGQQHMGNSEAMLVQASRQMQPAPNGYNNSMSARMSQPPPMQHQVVPHNLPNWDESNMGMMDGSGMAGDDGKKAPRNKKRRSTANSDGELRELFDTNRHRSLEDVSNELRVNERGPKAERRRQLYAMLWLDAACCESKNSVPRGRVYHMYASQCSDDRVIVLNPASFGKLVRILFPNLQTRRLGVRGESKYHYVNFDLREHPTVDVEATAPIAALSFLGNKESDMDASMTSIQPVEESGAGHLPSPADLLDVPSTRVTPMESKGSRSHSRYNVPRVSKETDWTAPSAKTPLKLSLMTEADKAADLAEPVVLPDITPFLPPQTDPDAAQSLMALYRSHCTSIIESLRYCREKQFFHLYACFHGTLTMPVQRTFAHPKVAAWIEKCDILLYQRCTRLISHLSHQVIPQRVMGSMRKIAEQLVSHIQESFRGQPEHVLDAKIGPATVFAGILDRMLRVNVSAHAMVREMSNGANRDQMFADWVQKINPRKIAECVPTRGMDDLVKLLVGEMRDLLSPENVSPELDTHLYPPPTHGQNRGNDGKSHLERFERFLLGLPQRFPYASHADIAWCVERVGTTIVRDMTLGVVASYSSWWVVKVFLDEEIWFLAEAGGFLRTEAIRELPAGSRATSAFQENGRQGSAADNAESERTQSPQVPAAASPGQSDRAPFPPRQHKEAPAEAPEIHDDSGIGIRTPDTDYPMDKFSFGQADNATDVDVDMDEPAALAL